MDSYVLISLTARSLVPIASLTQSFRSKRYDQGLRKKRASTQCHILQLLAPIVPPFYRGIGLNYKRHADEVKAKFPQNPIVFIKPPQTTAGPLDPVVIPTICQDGQVDYEAELAVVIGRTCKDVSKEEALDYVAGRIE